CTSITAGTFSEAMLFASSDGTQRTAPHTGSWPTPGTKTGATKGRYSRTQLRNRRLLLLRYIAILFVISRFSADRTSVELKRTLTPVSPRANRFNKLFIKSNSKTYCFNFCFL
ncbi:unnamed protein product, partial [Ixodes persulcatus]